MDFRKALLTFSLVVAPPLAAQPPAGAGGPWSADADGDGRLTRDELTASMERRFGLMDQDGDGQVPVPAMQRMLGHDRPRGDADAGQRDGQARPHGRRDRAGGGGPGGPGGPPSGPRPSPRGRADAGALPPPGHAMPWPEDGNDDGQIDRAEFLAPVLALFADRDRDGDGGLTAAELPPPPDRDGPPPAD